MIIGTLAPILPFDCWDHLEKRGLGTLDIDTDRVISCMVHIDPQKAIQKISPQLSVADSFNTVFQAWMKKDASQPIAWLNENAKNLSAVQKDRACQEIAYYAAKQGDFAVARQWSDRIVEPSIKEEIAKNTWFSESLRNDLGKSSHFFGIHHRRTFPLATAGQLEGSRSNLRSVSHKRNGNPTRKSLATDSCEGGGIQKTGTLTLKKSSADSC